MEHGLAEAVVVVHTSLKALAHLVLVVFGGRQVVAHFIAIPLTREAAVALPMVAVNMIITRRLARLQRVVNGKYRADLPTQDTIVCLPARIAVGEVALALLAVHLISPLF